MKIDRKEFQSLEKNILLMPQINIDLFEEFDSILNEIEELHGKNEKQTISDLLGSFQYKLITILDVYDEEHLSSEKEMLIYLYEWIDENEKMLIG